jgi:hypothetical protein
MRFAPPSILLCARCLSRTMLATALSALIAVGLLASPALGQTTSSSISGNVTDPTGAVVPGATVSIRSDATGAVSTATTNSHGSYTITNLQPGSYTVSASAKGFQTQVEKGTQLDPNIGRQLNFVLKLGSSSTTVTVNANSNALQTESATVGQLVTGKEVHSIQLNGRNPIYLSQLEPGVTRNAPMTSFNFAPDFGGPTINGARNDSILVTLDGAPMIRTRANGTTTGVADVDSLASVQILSTTYPAEYGGTDGGIIVQVPRSGTQQFHGSAFEYLRNSFFDANTWVRNHSDQPALADHPQAFRFNQFGWNLSGPIYIPHLFNTTRSKLFFLAGQEFLRYRLNATATGTVPTELMRQGNFSQLLGPNIFYSKPVQIVNPSTGLPYPNNVITTGLSPNGLALLNAYPAPNESGASYNWAASAPYPQNQRKDTLVIDYQPTTNQQLRFSLLNFNFNQESPFSGNFNRTPQVWNWPDQVAVLHYVWTINPTTINDATVSASADHVTINYDLSSGLYDRTRYGINYPYLFPAAQKLLPNKIPTIEIANFTTLDGGPYPSHSGGIIYTVADHLTKIIGNHTLSVGGMWEYSGENDNDQISVSSTTPGATNNQNGQFIFTDTRDGYPTSGAAVANTALGIFDTYGEIGQKSYTLFRSNMGSIFAQDDWHVTPRMVMEYGVRYDMIQPYWAKWRNQSMFNASIYNPADAPKVDPTTGQTSGGDPYDGVVIPGSGFPSSAQGHVPSSVLSNYTRLFHGFNKAYSPIVWSDIQPRFGLTDQVLPNTVVRLGVGRFVQRLGVNDVIQTGGNPPFQASETITAGNVDNPGGSTADSYPLALSSQSYHYPSPSAWAWSASIEQHIPKFANLTLSYVGRRGVHLQQLEDINQLRPGTIQANPGVKADALRPYQGFSTIIQASNEGSSIYNGMQVDLKRRLTSNLLFGVAYTWSKLMDYGSSRGYELPNYYNPKPDYGPADFDIRDVLVIDYVWTIPYGNHLKNYFARGAFANWQLSGVTQAQTGEPFSVGTGDDFAGVGPGAGEQLWDMSRTPDVKKQFSGSNGQGYWFDPSIFHAPAAGTLAPQGTRNAIYGPGFQSWNIAMQKSFHLVPRMQSQQLTFRAEAFNFTNHPNLDTPDSNPTSGTFGQVTTKGQTYSSDRELQFSLRYQF